MKTQKVVIRNVTINKKTKNYHGQLIDHESGSLLIAATLDYIFNIINSGERDYLLVREENGKS